MSTSICVYKPVSLLLPLCMYVCIYVCIEKILHPFCTKLKKWVELMNKTQNRPKVRFGRSPRAIYRRQGGSPRSSAAEQATGAAPGGEC